MKLWKRTVALMLITLLCSLIPVGVLSLYVTGKRSLNNAAETYGRQLANGKNLLEQFWDNSKYDFAIVDGSKEYPFVIKVKDTTAPVCASEVGQITIGVGQNIDWNSYFHATDLSGVTFEANVDTSTASTQDVQVKISDRFGNSVTKNVSVVVQ